MKSRTDMIIESRDFVEIYSVYDNHELARVDGSCLVLGLHYVDGYDYQKFNGKIPALYVVRDSFTRSLICGLELMDDGTIWSGYNNTFHKGIQSAIKEIEFAENTLCVICVEEGRIDYKEEYYEE